MTLKIIAIPRDPCPYQELFYGPMRRRGVRIHYGSACTPSHTLNLVFLPAELLWCRLRGYRLLHIHWAFGFAFTGSTRSSSLRRLSQAWFWFVLQLARTLGMPVVWTAHNVLPHARVFEDDVSARRTLVGATSLVLAHSEHALTELAELGARPPASLVIPLGPIAPAAIRRLEAPRAEEERLVLFLGRIEPYKGVEDLLEAMPSVPATLRVAVAGACSDPRLRAQLTNTAAALGQRATIRLEFVPDDELASWFGRADAVAYPFRAVTTSASVMLGMAAARPVIIPDLPALAAFPDAAVIRYRAGARGLREALVRVATMPPEELRDKGRAARAVAESSSWEEIADRALAAFTQILS